MAGTFLPNVSSLAAASCSESPPVALPCKVSASFSEQEHDAINLCWSSRISGVTADLSFKAELGCLGINIGDPFQRKKNALPPEEHPGLIIL